MKKIFFYKNSSMITYISLLRGINVSGKNSIKMDALKKAFEEAGFYNVTTYIQSGNIIFNSNETNSKSLEQLIFNIILNKFGFNVPVTILTIDELEQSLNKNPFSNNSDEKFIHFTFLKDLPTISYEKEINNKKALNEEIKIINKTIYLYCPDGYGKTKLTNNYLEKVLKVSATTRNLKTTNQLLTIAKEINN